MTTDYLAVRRVVSAELGRADLILPSGLSGLALDLRTLNFVMWCFPAMGWSETTTIDTKEGPTS